MQIRTASHTLSDLATTLRPAMPADIAPLHQVIEASRPDLIGRVPWIEHHDGSIEATTAYLRKMTNFHAEAVGEYFLVEKDASICGMAFLHNRTLDPPAASVGYWIGTRHVGQGLATSAVNLLVPHAFGRLRLHRLELRTARSNVASQRVAAKAGFKLHSVTIETSVLDGVREDEFVYHIDAELDE